MQASLQPPLINSISLIKLNQKKKTLTNFNWSKHRSNQLTINIFFIGNARYRLYHNYAAQKKKFVPRSVPPSIHKTRLIPRNWTTPFDATPRSLRSLGRSFAYFQPGYSKSRGVDVITSGHKRPAPLRLLFNCADWKSSRNPPPLRFLLAETRANKRRESKREIKRSRLGANANRFHDK